MNTILSLVFPKRDDYVRVQKLEVGDMHLKMSPTNVDGKLALSTFKDPDIRACIHEIKYHDNERAAQLLSILLLDWLRTQTRIYYIIPIPLSKKRHEERGYNQVARVIENATKDQPGVIYSERVLIRHRNTTPQTQLDKKDRRTNVKNAFTLYVGTNQYDFCDKHLLLIDDVLTTGSTLAEAEKVLRELGPASITTVALAH